MIRKLRLTTGLIMASFVIVHLSNHALGLVSVELMDVVLSRLRGFWQLPPVTWLLYGSVLTHFLLALWSLYRRTTLKIPRWELLQLLLGLSIPPLIFAHVIGTRIASELIGFELRYETTIPILWTIENGILRQTVLVLVVWGHLLIGLHYWQRLRPEYHRWLPLWQLLATLLPLLALLGFYRVGFELGTTDVAAIEAQRRLQHPEAVATLGMLKTWLPRLFWGALGLVLLARYLRRIYQVRFGALTIEHPTQGKIAALPGQTLLEALRSAEIPHSSVCGGRARCTTCRVRVLHGAEQLSPPEPAELRALQGIKVEHETDVRLACQLELRHDISIVPLIPPELGSQYVRKPGGVEGQEQRVTVLFIDLRGSTMMAEQRLPYDVVFVLNQFFAEMAEALNASQGHYAQFNGDGLMALYGLDCSYAEGCRRAVLGAQQMLVRLERINRRLGAELQQPLRVGIGIHSGEAIVGTMGPPQAPILSAIGDTINTAARLEAETKNFDTSLILSKETADNSGISLAELSIEQVSVRGRNQLLEVVVVHDPLALDVPRSLQ